MSDNTGITRAQGRKGVTSAEGRDGRTTAPDHPIFKPTDLPGLYLWYAADHLSLADGSPVGSWPNAGSLGAAGDLATATAAKKPTFILNGKNGLPVVRFDGVDDILDATGIPNRANPTTWFLACRRNSAIGGCVAGTGSGNNVQMAMFTFASNWACYAGVQLNGALQLGDTAWRRFTIQQNGVSSIFRQNEGVFDVTGDMGGLPLDINVTVGGGGSGANTDLAKDVGEVLVYNPGLTVAADRASVEDYLRAKWGT